MVLLGLILHLMGGLHQEVLALVHHQVVGLRGLGLDVHSDGLLVAFVHVPRGPFAFRFGTAVVQRRRHLQRIQVLCLLYRIIAVVAFLRFHYVKIRLRGTF
jgi:hypothetical protein